MAKPIFIIRTRKMSDVDRKEFHELCVDQFSDDYHVFIYDSEDEQEFKFQMFSDHEIEPIELDKLKEIVQSQ